MSSLVIYKTQQASLPFYAINNLIRGNHHIDVTNALLQTAILSRSLGDQLHRMTDNDYHVADYGDHLYQFNALKDIFEGERYGLGYEICEQIEALLEKGYQAITQDLYNIARQALINSAREQD